MKKMMVLIALALSTSTTFAATEKQDFNFKFNYQGETLEILNPASTYEEAFEKAADLCFKHFKSREARLTEDKGLDIIDVCANPRS